MSNQELIGHLYDSAGELLAVRYSIFTGGSDGVDSIYAIEFSFTGDSVATVYAEAEFDTVRLGLADVVVREDCAIRDASALAPWAGLLGGRLAWIWLLTNQQRYEDVFALSFHQFLNKL